MRCWDGHSLTQFGSHSWPSSCLWRVWSHRSPLLLSLILWENKENHILLLFNVKKVVFCLTPVLSQLFFQPRKLSCDNMAALIYSVMFAEWTRCGAADGPGAHPGSAAGSSHPVQQCGADPPAVVPFSWADRRRSWRYQPAGGTVDQCKTGTVLSLELWSTVFFKTIFYVSTYDSIQTFTLRMTELFCVFNSISCDCSVSEGQPFPRDILRHGQRHPATEPR